MINICVFISPAIVAIIISGSKKVNGIVGKEDSDEERGNSRTDKEPKDTSL